MADHTIIADIGQYLVDTLRLNMVPSPVQSGGAISLFAPDSGSVLSLALYDLEILNRSFHEGTTLPLALKYMLCVNSGASADIKAVTEHRILGKAISVLCSKPVIKMENTFLGGGDVPAEITLINLTIDERVKVCEHICGTFRTSFFFNVLPVFIDFGTAFKAAMVLHG